MHTLDIPVLTVWNVIVCIYYFTTVCKSETSEEVCKQEISSLQLMHVISDKVFKDIISMHGIGT